MKTKMFPGIKGKKVLVTGASGGIGASVAKLLSSCGAVVGLHYYQNEREANKIFTAIKKQRGKAELFKTNLLNPEERNGLIKSFIKTFGGIDILINNAGGVIGNQNFLELDENSWDATLSLNLKAPFFLSQKVFKIMKKQKWGRIINISSVAAKFGGSPSSLHYAGAKAGLEAITIGLAREGVPYNILVNAVRPGVIGTPFHEKIGRDSAKMEKRIDLIPLKRIGTPNDIASMVLYLASSYADFITSQIFTVSGGE